MSAKFKIVLLFAMLGYVAIVVLYGLAHSGANITPRPVLYSCLAPPAAYFATEDIYWPQVLVFLAPVNAIIYGGIALGLVTLLRDLVNWRRAARS